MPTGDVPVLSGGLDVDGRRVDITTESGLVVGVRKYSQTYVGGSVTNGTGRISSSTVTKTEFAAVGADGVERPHTLDRGELYLRDGHRVSFVYAACRTKRVLACVLNHSTREYVDAADPHELMTRLGVRRRQLDPDTWLAYAAVATLFTAGFGLVVFVPFVVGRVRHGWWADRLWRERLGPELALVRAGLLASTDAIAPTEELPWADAEPGAAADGGGM